MVVEKKRHDYIVEFDDVGFAYEESNVQALRHVTIGIEKGSCVVLVGSSGCGKTTLTRMINALIPAAYEGKRSGTVYLMGRPLDEWSMEEVVENVGSVFQNPRSQFVNMDTTSEMAFGCESLGMPPSLIASRIESSVKDLGIEHLLDRSVDELSGGEKQLVMLASVCAVKPKVLVLDEPTASLDVKAMQSLGEVLSRLKAQGMTIIVSEHRLWWLSEVADRIVFMKEGSIEREWSADEFGRLSHGERVAMGLRAWAPSEMIDRVGLNDGCDIRGAVSAEAVGLEAGYRRNSSVLDGLDFGIRPGKAVALVGRNGAGKTTLARCLTGLMRERRGDIRVAGTSVAYRKRAGLLYLVMQEPGYQLFSDTVEGELKDSFSRACLSVDDGRVDSLLDDLGLLGLKGRHPLSLSGGERQRLSVGASLAYGSQVMVLDEPTSGLDYFNMTNVAKKINKMKDIGVGICIITHDFEFLIETCDYLACLEEGRVVEEFPLTKGTFSKAWSYFGFG